jgi:enoyl-CoA hydratase/carnithine racemase
MPETMSGGSMTDAPLLVRDRDGVVRLTLNRPAKLNAISYELMVLLHDQLEQLAERPDTVCLVLEGSGRSFSAGFDLESLPDDPEKFGFMAATIDALEAFPRPTIARIHGHCLTGALELALACDILVTAEDAVFADTHSRWGLVPVCGLSVRAPERIGAGRARLLGFSGRRIGGATAAEWGLVDLCVSHDELDGAVDEIVGGIGANSADANRILKQLTRRGGSSGSDRQQRLEDERRLVHGVPEDRQERLAAATR